MLTCMPWNFLDRCDATKIVVLWKLLNVPESFVNIYIYIYIYIYITFSSIFLKKVLIVFFRTTHGLHRSEKPSTQATR